MVKPELEVHWCANNETNGSKDPREAVVDIIFAKGYWGLKGQETTGTKKNETSKGTGLSLRPGQLAVGL
jgi:hypothetical protein